MNKIRNALGCPGSLPLNELHCQKQPSEKDPWSISITSPSMNNTATEIWIHYFTLIFSLYNLPSKLIEHESELAKNAESLHEYLFSSPGTIDEEKLLGLLIGDPRKNKEPFDICKIKNKTIISNVFDYKSLTKKHKKDFAALILLLNVNVCPYCGRAFTTTIKKIGKRGGKNYIRTNQVDHYLPKSDYPWLALSIWNWIPVCGSCNLHKSSSTKLFLYPYEEEMGDIYRFATCPTRGMDYLIGAQNSKDNFDIILKPAVDPSTLSDDYKNHIKNELTIIGTTELYSSHKDYVCNMFRQRYIFGNPFIESLTKLKLFNTKEDVLAMMYFKRIDAESIGNSPLDKLTRDINHEIDVLQGEGIIPTNSEYDIQLTEIDQSES